jgi:hypothetical protein
VTLLWLLAVVLGAFLLAAMVQRVIMGRLEFKCGFRVKAITRFG